MADKERLKEIVRELADSLTINLCHHANDPNIGMATHIDFEKFKIYMADTGLFVTLSFWDKEFTDNNIYKKLLSDKLPVDLGYVFENVIAQIFTTAGNELFYYTWPTDSGKHNYEIDFILVKGNKINPVEVKSSGYKTHVSLDKFMEKYRSRIGNGYLIYTKDIRQEGRIISLPACLAPILASSK